MNITFLCVLKYVFYIVCALVLIKYAIPLLLVGFAFALAFVLGLGKTVYEFVRSKVRGRGE